jgi:GNAT superfamily N-acetyltransferase
VAWDGGVHAFVLDMMVVATHRRQGIGARLVAVAEARAAGCEWLHADFDDEHKAFYFDACGFRTPPAGVMSSLASQPRPAWPRWALPLALLG